MVRSFTREGHGELLSQLSATTAALNRNHAAGNRHQAAQARNDMRTWQVERRKRARQLIELGGLVVKAGIVEITGDDRAVIYCAMIWMADKLESGDSRRAYNTWTRLGNMAFESETKSGSLSTQTASGTDDYDLS